MPRAIRFGGGDEAGEVCHAGHFVQLGFRKTAQRSRENIQESPEDARLCGLEALPEFGLGLAFRIGDRLKSHD